MGKYRHRSMGRLYPTIAVSDAFSSAAHLAAAAVAREAQPDKPAWLGFTVVALASFIGTLRFGFSEEKFSRANEDLARVAAYLGLPLVGLTFGLLDELIVLTAAECVALTVLGAVLASSAASLPESVDEAATVLINVLVFILPVGHYGYARNDWQIMSAVALFAFAGVVIKPERETRLFGIRREDIFHYMIGIASYGMAIGLK